MTLYNVIKEVNGRFKKNLDAPIKDKDGKLLTSEEVQDTRWAEYLSEILNRPPPETELDISIAGYDLDIKATSPSKEETINAIKALKCNKALNLTTPTLSFSKQTQVLPQRFFTPS